MNLLIHPVSIPWWGLLDSPGKMPKFQNFSWVKPSSKLSTGEIRKTHRGDNETHQG